MDETEFLSDDDMAELDAMELVEKPATQPIIEKPKAPTNEEGESFVKTMVTQYPGCIEGGLGKEWTLAVLAIMHKVKYKPAMAHMTNRKDILTRDFPTLMRVVEKHLSTRMLEDLAEHVAEYAETHPAIKMTPEEVVLIETENGGLAYIDGGTEVESKAASKEQEGWASW